MGQHWQVLNVDRNEKKLVVARVAKLGNLFLKDLSDLYQSLRMPCLPKDVDQWLSRGALDTQQGLMGGLSTEVLDMIFKALLDDAGKLECLPWAIMDCLAFAVCCKRLLTIGKRHILRTLMSRYARDVDCRLVCLGEYARADDQAPTGMLTDDELKEIETAEVSDEEGKSATSVARQSLYGFASTHYQGRDSVDSTLQKPFRGLRHEYRHIRKFLGPSLDVMLDHDMYMVTALGGTDCYACPYPEGPNVLCNMSKGEYVLEEKLVDLQDKRSRVTLAHALLSRICYSPIQSVSIACDVEYADRLAKGPWAGDRFRITTVNELPVLEDGKEWRDVTEEAISRAKQGTTQKSGYLYHNILFAKLTPIVTMLLTFSSNSQSPIANKHSSRRFLRPFHLTRVLAYSPGIAHSPTSPRPNISYPPTVHATIYPRLQQNHGKTAPKFGGIQAS